GRNCDSENASLNSSAVIQRLRSTIIRRAHGSTPPKPETDIVENAIRSSMRLGGLTGASSGGAINHPYRAEKRPTTRFDATFPCKNVRSRPLFFRQGFRPIFRVPERSGYGDKR